MRVLLQRSATCGRRVHLVGAGQVYPPYRPETEAIAGGSLLLRRRITSQHAARQHGDSPISQLPVPDSTKGDWQ